MSSTIKINTINIGLMLFSCIAAFIMPFEVFLFAYAVMGPLHYLTEISWLHDRQYFTKGKYDHLILWIIGIIVLVESFAIRNNIALPFGDHFTNKITFVALTGSLLLIFVKNNFIKIGGLAAVFLLAYLLFKTDARDGLVFLLGSLLPTLIHVFVFTGFFILFGALKSRSVSGLLSFAVFIFCPILLFCLFTNNSFIPVTTYGENSYNAGGEGFLSINVDVLSKFFNVQFPPLKDADGNLMVYEGTNQLVPDFIGASQIVFHSQIGILLMRFIAFAYTYHYLNWFSKTEVIKWHKVPKKRFVAVIILWLTSLILYGINYSLGLRWLYFLSFCHVLLEFPLNMVSITGVFKETGSIFKNGFRYNPAVVVKDL